jgi:hypothetical protein
LTGIDTIWIVYNYNKHNSDILNECIMSLNEEEKQMLVIIVHYERNLQKKVK